MNMNCTLFHEVFGSNLLGKKMPETLQKKKIRLYDYLITAIQNPEQYPDVARLLIHNANRRHNCMSRADQASLGERVEAIEWILNDQRETIVQQINQLILHRPVDLQEIYNKAQSHTHTQTA